MAVDDARLSPPRLGLLALEGRVWLEFAALAPALPLLDRGPRGDGHPVLVLPGFLASDQSTRALRWFLRRRGYHAHGWRLGRNLGPNPELIAGLAKRFTAIRDRHQRKVSLIGWSLGGIYARELARHFASDVRQVITLGSPFRDPSATNAGRLFRLTRANRAPVANDPEMRARMRTPPPVPTTSLYSRTDGIVAWQSCLEEDGPLRQNIEIPSSHIGMGHHPAALYVIADRLAQAEDEWQPFASRGLPGFLFRARPVTA